MEVENREHADHTQKSFVNGGGEPSDMSASPTARIDDDADGPCPDSSDVSSTIFKSDLKKVKKVVENGLTDGDGHEKGSPSGQDASEGKEQKLQNINGSLDKLKDVELPDQDDKLSEKKSRMEAPNVKLEAVIDIVKQDDKDDRLSEKNNSKMEAPTVEAEAVDGNIKQDDKSYAEKDLQNKGNGTAGPEKSDEKNDSEKENTNLDNKTEAIKNPEASDNNKLMDSSNDDIQIIGESKIFQIASPSVPNSCSQNVILLPQLNSKNSPLPLVNQRFPPTSTVFSPNLASTNPSPFSSGFSSMHPGFIMGSIPTAHSSNLPMLPQPVSPPKPKSSLDQIELIRWEIQNRINTRPKYFKPNPTAELGPLAKFLFDIGSDLIKESVYHELVKIQSKKQDDDKLSPKEKDDLEKLKDIERDLNGTIGHLKLRMRKRCRMCHFQTESSNVMYHHKQFPHEDNKNLLCAHCAFATKQPMTFKFHMESEHNIQPRLHDKKFFYECDLCTYENNQQQKLTIHKQRCSKQYRPLFNLHPSCLSGAEINLCLENIFYKPLVPKNLKILQQKHLQQQAALAEARRQQAEVAALAAQKNAQTVVKRQRQPPPPTPQFNHTLPAVNSRPQIPARLPAPSMSQVRFNSRSPIQPVRPTVASMLKDKQSSKLSPGFPPHPGSAPVGFEVCEICGGYVKDRKALRIHFFYAHRIDLPLNLFDRNQPPLYCATCCVRFWTANGLRKHLDVHAQEKRIPGGFIGEGVSGKCIACGQLVGNIVVHMRVVHNREIHHYINALMCMFCGASFNSHANVERHVKDVHGTIDIATGAVKVKGKLKSSPPMHKIVAPPKRPTPTNNSLVKGSVCVLCNLNFGRNVDLTRHCMRMHHTCMKCGMVVIDKASLLKHTCLSSPSGTRDCTMCSEAGFHPAYYVKHLRDKHLKKFSIDVARLSIPVIERWTKRSYPFKEVKEDLVEISDSDDDVPIAQFKVQTSTKSPRKKPRIGPASKINRLRSSNGNFSNSCDIVSAGTNESTHNRQEHSRPAKSGSSFESPGSHKRKYSSDSSGTPERSSKRKK